MGWRLYIDGKQKISLSGTPNLEEAIPILEKWFDDIHANKEKEKKFQKLKKLKIQQKFPNFNYKSESSYYLNNGNKPSPVASTTTEYQNLL